MQDSLQQVVAANNRFGFKLLGSLVQEEVKTNLFFSPFSIAMCLAMVANGAANETRQEILEVLAQEADLDAINQANRELVAQVNSVAEISSKPKRTLAEICEAMRQFRDNEMESSQRGQLWREIVAANKALWKPELLERHFQLTIANSLWTRTNVALKSEFRARCWEYYKARVSPLDFANRTSVNTINNWVRTTTKNAIQQLVNSIPPQTTFIAANAIYFKASWAAQFWKSATKLEKFYLSSGEQIDCHMMHHRGHYNYWEDDELQIIKLPYVASDTKTSVAMYIILPRQRELFSRLLQRFDFAQCETLINHINKERLYGDLELPQFSAEYGWDLTNDLIRIGMGRAFDPHGADFSQLSKTSQPIWLSAVPHKAVIKVDEEGTAAAAVTGTIVPGSARKVPLLAFQMKIDHPFLYLIRENETGSILFMGVTMDPRK